MTESTRKRIVYATLVGAVVFGAYNFTVGKKKPSVLPAGAELTTVAAQATVAGPNTASFEYCSNRPWGRDPFSTGTAAVVHRTIPTTMTAPGASLPVWVLSGVVYNDRHPLAFVNRKAVGVGDTIDQARVVKITKNKVTLEYNGSRFDIFVAKG